MSSVSEAHELLSSAIFLLAKESKNPDLRGEWLDSIRASIGYARQARELLEGIQ